MKILQVFDFFSLPHGGGTVDVISKLSKALVERGHEVTICTGDYELDGKYIHIGSAENHFDLADPSGKISIELFHSYFNRFGMYIVPSLRKFDIEKYDVVHFHCCRSFQNIVLGIKAIAYEIPYVVDAHGSAVDRGAKNIIRHWYDFVWGDKFFANASRLIAETEVGVAEWRKLGADLAKITLLHPFIDIKEFEGLPERGTFARDYNIKEHIILFLGRINKEKGLEFLVKSFAQLLKTRQDVFLVLAGQDDGYLDELGRIATSERVNGKVFAAGFLTGKEKLSALVDASMLIQPSKNEAGARPSLEALMCNTSVIVTRYTGAGLEIKKMDAGYLTTYGDVRELAETMNALLGSDPILVKEKVENGKRYIRENLSLESQIPKYENLYREVIG